MSRLPDQPRPERYSIHLKVMPEQDRFQGEVEIELSVTPGMRTIELHAVDLDIRGIQLEDSGGSVQIRKQIPRPARETLQLELARGLRGRSATLRIQYEGGLRDDLRGLYRARSGRRRYAVTQLEAADARRFFPCFDEPDRKARFRIRVTTARNHQLVSNSPIEWTRTRGALKTVQFAETPRLSTYLIALVVGDLEASRTRRCGQTPIRIWHVPGKKHLTRFALETAVASLERLERYFGLPYPYAKLDLIAVPDFEFGAMENAGAVIFRESLLLIDPRLATLGERKRVAEVIAHELAHMWFGNLVTMSWWDDLWLNESFATWMAFRVVDDWKPEWRMWLDFSQHRAAAYTLDSLENTHPIYATVETPDEATENFDLITYEKGASVVRMLERWLGASTFRRGVRRYIRRHRESNARANDLWQALEEVSGQPVRRVARNWIERPGFPALSLQCRDRGGQTWLVAQQQRFLARPLRPGESLKAGWLAPIGVRVRRVRGRDLIVRDLLTKDRQWVCLGPSGSVRWAYGNAEEAAFLRPLHSSPLLEAIVQELPRLAPEERMGLIGHQWAGLRADRTPLEDFLRLVPALAHEREPEVLEALATPLHWLREQVVPILEAQSPGSFQRWLRDIFGDAFAELGWSAARHEDDLTRLRRAALLRILAGIGEDPELTQEAGRRVRAYLKSRSTLEPNLAGPVVEIAARNGSKSLYEAYRRRTRSARTPQERIRFQMALASFRDPALFGRTLEALLDPELPTQDVVLLAAQLLANPAARNPTWSFVQSHWSQLEPRISGGLAPRLVNALSALQTRSQRQSVARFFRAHPLPTARRALLQTLERFDLDAELRRRITPGFRAWLARCADPSNEVR